MDLVFVVGGHEPVLFSLLGATGRVEEAARVEVVCIGTPDFLLAYRAPAMTWTTEFWRRRYLFAITVSSITRRNVDGGAPRRTPDSFDAYRVEAMKVLGSRW